MLSRKLIKEIWREMKGIPQHAQRVMDSRTNLPRIYYQKFPFGEHAQQYLCWFEPKQVTQAETIIFFHGGGWTFGAPEFFGDRAWFFMQQGFRVVMPAHRKLPRYNFRYIREDLVLALQKIHELLEAMQVASKKLLLGGMSSGGNLAALATLDDSILDATPFSSDAVTRGMFFAAPLHLGKMTPSFVLTNYAGRRNSDTFQEASPISHLKEGFDKPLLVVHGTNDGLVNYSGTFEFVENVEKISTAPLTFYTIPEGSHLQATTWVYEPNDVRQTVLNWLHNNP